jgi:hypothetical protein
VRLPYFWINGPPPKEYESPEFHELMRDGFRDWRLEVGGLVRAPVWLSLDDLKAMPSRTRITKHNCAQAHRRETPRFGQADPLRRSRPRAEPRHR